MKLLIMCFNNQELKNSKNPLALANRGIHLRLAPWLAFFSECQVNVKDMALIRNFKKFLLKTFVIY